MVVDNPLTRHNKYDCGTRGREDEKWKRSEYRPSLTDDDGDGEFDIWC
jgi:hypothetical protein